MSKKTASPHAFLSFFTNFFYPPKCLRLHQATLRWPYRVHQSETPKPTTTNSCDPTASPVVVGPTPALEAPTTTSPCPTPLHLLETLS